MELYTHSFMNFKKHINRLKGIIHKIWEVGSIQWGALTWDN